MKVLIISHNPITSFDAMGKTMLTLFFDFKKEELCQLYIYPTIPNIDKCNSYFRITDKDVLKSYFKFKVKGREISSKDIVSANGKLFENSEDTSLYRNRKNKKPFRILVRDLMWRFSKWFNKPLKKWIEREKPTHIFLAPGKQKFIYKIALKISKKYNLPIITYICDDYYFVKKAESKLGRIQQKKLNRITRKLLKNTSQIITICDRLKNNYQNAFGVSATTVMTGSNYEIEVKPKDKVQVNDITYLGNIRCNRYNSIVEIGKTLDQINLENGTDYSLKIYTGEADKDILSSFDGIKSIKLCGYVSGKEFDKTFFDSDILLHTEAFDDKSIDLVKNSISTKIADSLASGICLFAYGPKEVASIEYLIDNECAVVCADKEKLKATLINIFVDKELRDKCINNAIQTAERNHDTLKVGKAVREVFEKVNDESSAS